jgi:hypothetical protein
MARLRNVERMSSVVLKDLYSPYITDYITNNNL